MRFALLFTVLLAMPLTALAADPAVAEAQRMQLETVRSEVASQIQFQAFDLLDELVYGWTQQPVFELETPVVLADVTVPVGFGSGLQALIENHFVGLVVKNPRSKVVLTHCPQCTALVVHSGAKGTVVARGVDQPETLNAAATLSGSRHALFLDFEAEGSALVLRARMTSLEPSLPIIHARTLSTSTSSAALLRTGDHLKSATEARKEYLDALQGRSTYLLPMRIGVRSFAQPDDGSSPVLVAPFIWLQLGLEASLTQARAWTGSVSVGASWMPELHTGGMAQARISRLLSGTVSSLTRPDLYAFLGGSIFWIHGQSANLFQATVPTLQQLRATTLGSEPDVLYGAYQVGLELRVKNRIGVGIYLEALPSMNDAQALGTYLNLDPLKFQSYGAEVTFCF